MINRLIAIAAALALPAGALAQTLTEVKVEPAEIRAGESVKITVNFETERAISCGLRLHLGDGTTIDYKINQQKDLSLTVPHTYAKAGDYRIMAEPKTVGTLLKCNGKNQTTALKVAAPAATAGPAMTPRAAAALKAAAAAQCPEGWTLDKKSIRNKTGAYTCRAAPGTKLAGRPSCPGDLTYFENVKKGVMGCRP